MKCMLFAAGLGVRLRPLTEDRPKALVEVAGRSLLYRNLDKLADAGVSTCVVNAHHFSSLIYNAIQSYDSCSMKIYFSDESEELLDTGGGLLKASGYLEGNEPILIHNVDILCDFPPQVLEEALSKSHNDVLLAVSNRVGQRKLIFDKKQRLCGWINHDNMNQCLLDGFESPFSEECFSGISIIRPQLLNDIPFSGKFGIISLFLHWTQKYRVSYYDHSGSLWFDVGSPEKLKWAEKSFEL